MKTTLKAATVLLIAFVQSAFAGNAQSECTANFEVSGSFFSGKKFTTNVSYPSLKTDQGFKRANAAVTKEGFQIVLSDKETGTISASQQVSGAQGGKTAPLNVLVEEEGSGSKVTFTFATAPMLVATEDSVRDGFCKMAVQIEGK